MRAGQDRYHTYAHSKGINEWICARRWCTTKRSKELTDHVEGVKDHTEDAVMLLGVLCLTYQT